MRRAAYPAPRQRLRWQGDGSLQLSLPYADATELSMDILRHGDQVRVLEPADLAALVAARLRRAAHQYDEGGGDGSAGPSAM